MGNCYSLRRGPGVMVPIDCTQAPVFESSHTETQSVNMPVEDRRYPLSHHQSEITEEFTEAVQESGSPIVQRTSFVPGIYVNHLLDQHEYESSMAVRDNPLPITYQAESGSVGGVNVPISDGCYPLSNHPEEFTNQHESDHGYLHQEENEVPFHSLPMVKKYYPFAETLSLSFLQPMEVVTLTRKGKELVNEREGTSVCVSDDTIPVGRILHLELGSSMHGRLSFPPNVSPVSPILWICPQEDIPLQKPIKITLPHTVKYEEGTSELMFMKVHHEMPLSMPTSMEYGFEFEEMICHEGVEFNEKSGSIFTKQFCPVCIVEKTPKPSTKTYLMLRTQPRNCNTSKFSVDYSVIYRLPTCLETFRSYCTKKELELRCDWDEFIFTSNGMELTEPQATSSWMVEVQSMKNMIKESEVDFWQYDVDLLKLYQEIRRYPPKITVTLHGSRATGAGNFKVHFSGTSPTLQDYIFLSPEEYSAGWKQHPLHSGKKTREYVTLLKNLTNLVDHLHTVPRSKERLCLKFIENEWIGTATNPSERELILLSLNRVEKDSRSFVKFVSLLNEIGGLKEVAESLTRDFNPLTTDDDIPVMVFP